jgi:hypothetical protein
MSCSLRLSRSSSKIADKELSHRRKGRLPPSTSDSCFQLFRNPQFPRHPTARSSHALALSEHTSQREGTSWRPYARQMEHPLLTGTAALGRRCYSLHGTTCDHTTWADVLLALERHFSVYVMGRRGRGQTGNDPVYAHARLKISLRSLAPSKVP